MYPDKKDGGMLSGAVTGLLKFFKSCHRFCHEIKKSPYLWAFLISE